MSDGETADSPAVRESSPGRGKGKKIAASFAAVAIICAAVAAVILTLPPQSPSELPCDRSETMPIDFSSVTKAGIPPFNNSASWDVTCVSRRLASATSYEVRIHRSIDASWSSPQPLVFGTIVMLDQIARTIITDADGNGKLSVGDIFLVYGMEDHYYWKFYVGSADHPEGLGAANWDTKSALPTIAFSQPTYGGTPGVNATVNWNVVSTVQRTYSFSHYKAKIKKDGVSLVLSPKTLSGNAVLIFGAFDYDVKLIVSDLTADGNLTVGDRFSVYQLPSGHSWNFTLFWFQDSVDLEWIDWTTAQMPRPVVKFSTVTKDGTPPFNNTANWTVAEVSGPAYTLNSYGVTVAEDGNTLTAYPLNLTAGYAMAYGAIVRVLFGDLGGDGVLTVGDSFLVYGMLEPHAWSLALLWWHDSTILAWANWTTGPTKPMVSFSSPIQGGSGTNLTMRWAVAASSGSCVFSLFEVQIEMDAVPVGPAVVLSAGAVISLGGTVSLILSDANMDGKLTAGDMFFVYGMPSAHIWKFHLIWAMDGTDVQTFTWNT